jgi:hypothetical protein
MLKHCALALAAAVLASGAQADLKGTYQLQKGKQLNLYYRDEQHMRASVGDDKQLLIKGAETWVLKRQDAQWLALNADGVGGLLRAMNKGDATQDLGPVQMRPLGRKETVAGYTGEVYEASSGDNKYEVVLSDNADVQAMTDAWRQMAQKLSKYLGQQDVQRLQQALDAIPKGKGGLLRQGDNLTLVSIDKKISNSDVEFPAGTKVMQLPQLSLPAAN